MRRFCLGNRFRRDRVTQLQVVGRYGIVAGLVIVTGLLLVFFGEKGRTYYAHAIFWTKMAVFVTIAFISILPTVAYLRWNTRLAADGSVTLEDAEYSRLRGLVWLQIGRLILLPLCAALMANGLSAW